MKKAPWVPGMGVFVRGKPARLLDVHVGWFLAEGDYYELLVVEAGENPRPEWVLEKHITLDTDDLATRSILEWTSHLQSVSSCG
jgi:hypothetical protein